MAAADAGRVKQAFRTQLILLAAAKSVAARASEVYQATCKPAEAINLPDWACGTVTLITDVHAPSR